MTALVVASRLHSWRPHDCTLNDAIAIEFVQWRILIVKRTIDETKKARYMAEAKVLRAYFYYKLNIVYKGVPIYLEPVEASECYEGQSSEAEVWKTVINDLTEAIAEPALPEKYGEGAAEYGRATKGLAYALRGKAYLYQKDYANAARDFEAVGSCGYSLFQGEYKQLFKEANEQSPEMIFSVQCIGLSGLGNEISFRYGTRSSFGSCWNTYLASTDFVESYENADGSPFDWDDYIPGYNEMDVKACSVYFLRDGMTDDEKTKLANAGADMSKYLPEGNERRWEFNGEGINFFDEMRWGTWKESKFFAGSGLKQMWGEPQYVYAWSGDQVYTWPAPWSERQLNEDLTLADGWKD